MALPGGPALVGYQSKFRLRWFATKLHLFTVVVPAPQATAPLLDDVIRQSIEYAKRTKGRLRGLQTGVAIIPALVAADVQSDARTAVEARPGRAWAAIALPTIVDLAAGETYLYRGRLIWGGIYGAWLRERIAATLS